MNWILELSFPELSVLHNAVAKLYRTRLADEEKKLLKQYKVGDLVTVSAGGNTWDLTIKVHKITGRKLIGSEETSPGMFWRVSPIICTKQEGGV